MGWTYEYNCSRLGVTFKQGDRLIVKGKGYKNSSPESAVGYDYTNDPVEKVFYGVYANEQYPEAVAHPINCKNADGSGSYFFDDASIYQNVSGTQSYYLDLNFIVDGTVTEDASIVKADVYINGTKVASGVKDYYVQHPNGTTYEIKNIVVASGYSIYKQPALSGTLTAKTALDIYIGRHSTYSFNANGGTGAPSNYTKVYGTGFVVPTAKPTRSGYIFAGWTEGTSGTTIYLPGKSYSTEDKAITFYAKWIAYTQFNLNYDSIPPNLFSYNFLYGHTTHAMPSSAGITASVDHSTGIVTLNGTTTKSFDLGVTRGLTITTNDTYTMTLTYVSGSWSSQTSGSDEGCLAIDFTTVTNRQYANFELPTSSNPTIIKIMTPSSATVSDGADGLLTWIWHNAGYVFNNYRFQINIVKGSSTTFSPNTKFYTTDATYGTLPTPESRTGYTFNGWFTASSGGNQVTSSSSFSGNNTLYAQWTPNTRTYSFDANGGIGAPSNQEKIYGVHFVFPTIKPVREGYKFVGWTQGTSGTTVYSAGAQYVGMPDENITFYAKWTELTSDERKIYIYNDGSIEAAMFRESDSKFGFYNTGTVYAKSFVEGSAQFKITADGKIYCKQIIERC